MKPESSRTTTQAEAACSETGTPLGGAGAIIGSDTDQDSLAIPHRTELVERLAARTPHETDQAMSASLRSSHKMAVSMRYSALEERAEIEIRPMTESPNYLAAAQAVELSLTPLPTSRIAEMLMEMDVATAKRSGDVADAAMRMKVYIGMLAKEPADCVVSVLSRPRTWWPATGELADEIQRLALPRRALATRLRRLHTHPPARPGPKPTEAERARMQKRVDDFLSSVPTNRPKESESSKPGPRSEARDAARMAEVVRLRAENPLMTAGQEAAE